MNWRCTFDTILNIEDISKIKYICGKVTIDITDHNVSNEKIQALKRSASNNQILVQDKNWFGGTWSLTDYLKAENILSEYAQKISFKNLSPFEKFICAYHFATNRNYKFAPSGSPFQACRSYVDAINKGYCVCVGYATILKRLCEKLGIQCAVQGCLAKNKEGKTVNHANCLVLLNDDKYDICGLYYSDPRMDYVETPNNNMPWNLNMLALPMTDIEKILIKLWNDDTIIQMNDFKSIYYTRFPTQIDLDYYSKFFEFKNAEEITKLKYCKNITFDKIANALKNIGLSQETIEKTTENYQNRKALFIQEFDTKSMSECQKRMAFCQYIREFVSHTGRMQNESKLDCATLVYLLFKNFFDIDITKGGYGASWTGKIATSKFGAEPNLVDENIPLMEKIKIIDTECKIGDILLFHRQSQNEHHVTNENYFPGHCAIYLGDHKFIDSRLTTRGGIDIVDIENDSYMQNFVGFKNIISSLNPSHLSNDSPTKTFSDFD